MNHFDQCTIPQRIRTLIAQLNFLISVCRQINDGVVGRSELGRSMFHNDGRLHAVYELRT